jgi:hypothetical protein
MFGPKKVTLLYNFRLGLIDGVGRVTHFGLP